ncbi:unnamed protein product, partial [Gulo gulo]
MGSCVPRSLRIKLHVHTYFRVITTEFLVKPCARYIMRRALRALFLCTGGIVHTLQMKTLRFTRVKKPAEDARLIQRQTQGTGTAPPPKTTPP